MSDRDPEGKDAPAPGHPRAEEVVNLFKRGLKFTEELLADNERLRYRIASLEAEVSGARRHMGAPNADAVIEALRQQIQELELEKMRLLDSYLKVEETSRDFQSRYAEIEEEHNNLANLYIASYQLHSTLAFREVVQVITEIVINLVGVARFTLFIRDAKTDMLHPICTEGHDLASVAPVKVGEGAVGRAVHEKTTRVSADGTEPLAIVPLTTLEDLVGAIAIDELLVQKDEFTRVDHELLTLLGVHGATALVGGLLRERHGSESLGNVLDIDRIRQLLAG